MVYVYVYIHSFYSEEHITSPGTLVRSNFEISVYLTYAYIWVHSYSERVETFKRKLTKIVGSKQKLIQVHFTI